VIGAGSLGARPRTGIELYEAIEPGEAVALVVAALRFFNAEGDRERRTRARLRHVRERLGDEAFRARLDEAFRAELSAGAGASGIELPRVEGGLPRQAHLRPPLGDLEPSEAEALADAADGARAEMRLGIEHDLLIYGAGPVELGAGLEAMRGGPAVVACPGKTWCQRGIADSRSAARAIREALGRAEDLSVHVTGCPNDCGHAATADVGLIGRKKRIGGEVTECFGLLAGGEGGRGPALGRELHGAVPSERVAEAVARLARERRERAAERSFAAFVEGEQERLREVVASVAG
jgi:ferredoxin-nitrite reductase